jgi:tetratricopeptide (TPR) repeat protein
MPTDVVRAWTENLHIPTYPAPTGDRNPMFLERRNNQGASGRIYPSPIDDYVNTHKVDQVYEAVFLENAYIQLILLPQLGGRIFAGLDKTNGVDFFYRQHVIKPALIGLYGSWISGGVEFNWPQHHRPSTFMPVSYLIEEDPDGGRTVWLSEHEPTQRMKGMVGVCLHPGKALVETKVRLHNRTPLPQTFLFWENVAVSVNDQYQIFFPPDVTHVVFHSKHEMAHYPVAREVYCGFDLRQGVDISWHRNSSKATSYFAGESAFDFFGGYDHGRQVGLMHIANHHVSPGKKLFTWGNDEFSKVWEQNLTDADGPYAELMAGSYTDNQPDFSWLRPYESKSFSQVWYPFHELGTPQLANQQAAIRLIVEGGQARAGVYVTEVIDQARVSLHAFGRALFEQTTDLAPGAAFWAQVQIPPEAQETDLTVQVAAADGQALLAYKPVPRIEKPLPTPADPPPPPHKIETLEGLFLAGLHVEQYLHPTLDADAYRAARAPSDYCFPARLEELEVLVHVRAEQPEDARAAYYLGNLLYDKRQYEPAIQNWQEACRLDPAFPTAWRNLGLAHFNVRHDALQAKACYERALSAGPDDHRVFYELVLLLRHMAVAPAECLALLETRLDLVAARDPLYLEQVTLYNTLGQPQRALELLLARRFYPWEGLEGLIADQYALAHLRLGRQALAAGASPAALAHFEAGWHFPPSLGAGRWSAVADIPCQYYSGVALDQQGQHDAAGQVFTRILAADDSPWSLGSLPALPYYKARALQHLERAAEAEHLLDGLLAAANAELANPDPVEPANSQPLQQDAEKLKRIQQTYLVGLARLGLGRTAEAQRAFREVLALDPHHQLSQMELDGLP